MKGSIHSCLSYRVSGRTGGNKLREFERDGSYFSSPREKLSTNDRRKRSRGPENKIPFLGGKKRYDGTSVYKDHQKHHESTLFPMMNYPVASMRGKDVEFRELIKKRVQPSIPTDFALVTDSYLFGGYKHDHI